MRVHVETKCTAPIVYGLTHVCFDLNKVKLMEESDFHNALVPNLEIAQFNNKWLVRI